jgi:tripartite ATP-independent transporter DctP family solute receptor
MTKPSAAVIYSLLVLLAGGAAEARDFRSSDVYPFDYPTVQAVAEMDRLIRQRSKNRLAIDPVGYDDRSSESYAVAQVRAGTLDMARINLVALNRTAPLSVVPALPFLFKSSEHMRHVLDGPIGVEILASLEAQGVVGLCFYDAGPRSLYSVKRPIRKASDLKGLKVRVQQSDAWATMLRAVGAEPVSMPLDRVQVALQLGIVDAADSDWSSYVATGHYRIARHFSVTQHSMSPGVVIFSKRVWDDLSKEDQTIVRSAARDSVGYMRKIWDESEAAARTIVEAAGVDIIVDVDRKSFADALVPLYPTVLDSPKARAMAARIQNEN